MHNSATPLSPTGGDIYTHSIHARPSFERRQVPQADKTFAIVNVLLLLALGAVAVVDYMVKAGRWGQWGA